MLLLFSLENHTTTLHSGNQAVACAVYGNQQYLNAKIQKKTKVNAFMGTFFTFLLKVL